MKNEMYPGAEEPLENEDKPAGKETPKEETHQTALLPVKFFEGQELKPGEQYYVTVERIFEDEVEVSYPKKEEVEGKEKEGNMTEANEALDLMATEGNAPGNPGPSGY